MILNNPPLKALLVFGTRPEAIKMCPLAKSLLADPRFEVRVCVTAQHRKMLDQVLEIFEIKPDYDLDLMKQGQTLEWLTSTIIEKVSVVIEDFKPQLVLVHGDTTTSFAAALAAFYKKVDIGHVEAGLRTGDIHSPWPEEANRKLTSTLTRLHFAPTQSAADNLQQENVPTEQIFVTGNTVIDALHTTVKHIKDANYQAATLSKLIETIKNKKLILITGHRRENFGQGFENICLALKEIAQNNPDVVLIYPVHLNPQVQEPVNRHLSGIENFHLINPLNYQDFVFLMDRADIILTDSGGIQEEAPSLHKPVLVLRDKTERPEAVKAGTVKLVGTNQQSITSAVETLLKDASSFEELSNPYGDGQACQRIKHIIATTYRL
ncbi:UDP-N-acetylglucosamine 2-epimerase (non-hydrolyzing) [Shewanella sp. KT0246]|uniref:non-hydrolyzing UDP-N-acetylglucosamine 2-epimerase n=1 Tax=uncultured Shewanella sp. TaxID=173975 RepID=UPI001C7E1849|nr:UDP-N-acetylglucosamine 2-epimerase (non-hydrolyzing) [Shewanella sp. KT0246]